MENDEKILICTHATLRVAFDGLDEKKLLQKKTQDLLLKTMIDNSGQRMQNAVQIDGLVLMADSFGDLSRDLTRQIGARMKPA